MNLWRLRPQDQYYTEGTQNQWRILNFKPLHGQKWEWWGTASEAQWLRLRASNTGGTSLISGRETRIPHAQRAWPIIKEEVGGVGKISSGCFYFLWSMSNPSLPVAPLSTHLSFITDKPCHSKGTTSHRILGSEWVWWLSITWNKQNWS